MFQLLTSSYENMKGLEIEDLQVIPKRAVAINAILIELEKQGVHWLSFQRISLKNRNTTRINTGYQVVGSCRGKWVALASGVGVRHNASCFLASVTTCQDELIKESRSFNRSGGALTHIQKNLGVGSAGDIAEELKTATFLLSQIFISLPTRRDWLDPDVELAARNFIAEQVARETELPQEIKDAIRKGLES